MSKLKIGTEAPDFALAADDGSVLTLSALRGQRVLLVFYPGDHTPVCTAQLCEYRDGFEEFRDLNCTVLGISGDDLDSHRAFKRKHQLPFTLLSDPQLKVAEHYGAKGLLGLKRACFLIDAEGILRWQHVELTALFRRGRAELVAALNALN